MSSIQHFQNCQKLFYCSCGLVYSTKQLLKYHLLRNDRCNHKAVPDPEEEKEKELINSRMRTNNKEKYKLLLFCIFDTFTYSLVNFDVYGIVIDYVFLLLTTFFIGFLVDQVVRCRQ